MSDVLNAVLSQYDNNNKPAKKQKVSDEERLKKYFSITLAKKDETGQKRFRILQPKNGHSPFVEVWFHEIKVGKDWVKLYCPKKNKSENCPLCLVEEQLRSTGLKSDKDAAKDYTPRKFYITKGIDRDLEADGPKFWRFRHNYEKQGVLDKIVPVFSAKGNITDPNTGRDLILFLGKNKDGFTVVQTVMHDDACPLSTDKELMKSWIDDDTTWEDVYSKKSYDYLHLVAQGEIPYWDKDAQKFISKRDWEAKNNNGVSVETLNDDGESSATIGGLPETDSGKPTNQFDDSTEDVDVTMDDLPF